MEKEREALDVDQQVGFSAISGRPYVVELSVFEKKGFLSAARFKCYNPSSVNAHFGSKEFFFKLKPASEKN